MKWFTLVIVMSLMPASALAEEDNGDRPIDWEQAETIDVYGCNGVGEVFRGPAGCVCDNDGGYYDNGFGGCSIDGGGTGPDEPNPPDDPCIGTICEPPDDGWHDPDGDGEVNYCDMSAGQVLGYNEGNTGPDDHQLELGATCEEARESCWDNARDRKGACDDAVTAAATAACTDPDFGDPIPVGTPVNGTVGYHVDRAIDFVTTPTWELDGPTQGQIDQCIQDHANHDGGGEVSGSAGGIGLGMAWPAEPGPASTYQDCFNEYKNREKQCNQDLAEAGCSNACYGDGAGAKPQ